MPVSEKYKHEGSVLFASSDTIVCYCAKVTKSMLLEAIANGCQTLPEPHNATDVCPENNDCARNHPQKRCCIPDVLTLLKFRTYDDERSDISTLYKPIMDSTQGGCCAASTNTLQKAKNEYTEPVYKQIARSHPEGESLADYIVSVSITAQK